MSNPSGNVRNNSGYIPSWAGGIPVGSGLTGNSRKGPPLAEIAEGRKLLHPAVGRDAPAAFSLSTLHSLVPSDLVEGLTLRRALAIVKPSSASFE